ncbi:MAG: Gfo/Idh/MocA family oxidoreductase [Devosia marina]|uniref:Gfo/Idh/MocA family protein n=1 Tax=Devosia marina TaxID=2683198 RepID=UPI0032EEDDB6
MQPRSVLIVGGGNIAGGFDDTRGSDALPLTHAGAFSRNPAFRIAAIVEPNAERRAAFASRWNVPEVYSKLAELPAHSGAFDVVSICSPTAAHPEDLARAVALRPRLIFCEKPLTGDVESSRQAVASCEDAGITLVVNHNRRWAPDLRRLRDEIREGAWGTMRSATGFYNKGILNNGSHMLDLLADLFGTLEPAWAGTPIWDYWPDDPTIPASLYARDGFPVLLNAGDARDYAFFELELALEKAVIRMESGGGNWRMRRSVDSPTFAGYRALDAGQIYAGQYESAMSLAIAEIAVSLDRGTMPSSSGKSALATQELCNTIRRLSESSGAAAQDRKNP